MLLQSYCFERFTVFIFYRNNFILFFIPVAVILWLWREMATPGTGVQHIPGNRQRLRPWLIDQINSGNYPGVSWVNKDDMIFKIPWKHFGKPGVNEERDAKIFREWAKHTGKYKEGDPSDASTWKTRFRCALYKLQDIEELSNMNMLDGEEPYRVYRFRSKGMDSSFFVIYS